MMGQAAAAVPPVSFLEYFSYWAAWPPNRPHERGSGSESDQIQTGLSVKDLSQSGLTTRLCESLRPGPRH